MRHHSSCMQRVVSWMAVIMFLTGCIAGVNEPKETNMGTIEGTVWYRERLLLPPGAEVSITLEDIARMDVKSELIAETRFIPKGEPPWEFTLEYDSIKIHEKGRYALRARIQENNKLMFISTEHIPAFDRDSDGPVKILVFRVAGQTP